MSHTTGGTYCPHGVLDSGGVRCLNCHPLKDGEGVLAPLTLSYPPSVATLDTLTMTTTPCPNCKRMSCPLHATFVTAVERGFFGPTVGYLDSVDDCLKATVNHSRIQRATLDAIRTYAVAIKALGNPVSTPYIKELLDLLDRDY
jgi:hypothetical protein